MQIIYDAIDSIIKILWNHIKSKGKLQYDVKPLTILPSSTTVLNELNRDYGLTIYILHGNPDGMYFRHQRIEPVVENRVIIAISCWTAKEWGLNIKDKVRTYLGWCKPYIFTEKYLEQTLKPIELLIYKLQEGYSLGEIILMILAIPYTLDSKIPPDIKKIVEHNINSMRLYGDRHVSKDRIYSIEREDTTKIFFKTYKGYINYLLDLFQRDIETIREKGGIDE